MLLQKIYYYSSALIECLKYSKLGKFKSALSTTFWYPIFSVCQSTNCKNFIQRFSQFTFFKVRNSKLLQNLNISKANDLKLMK